MKLRLCVLFWLAFISPASANMGLPMIVLTLPGMLTLLIPIILIEGYFVWKKFDMSFSKALKMSSVANVVSTVLGIPITWFLFFIIEILLGFGIYSLATNLKLSSPQELNAFIFIIQAPWLGPEIENSWMIPAAQIVMLIPYFYASWIIEAKVAERIEKELPRTEIKQAFLKANLTTYTLLGIMLLIAMLYLILSGK